MSIFVEVLKRNYLNAALTIEKLDELLAAQKITQTEYDYITEV